VVQQYAASSQPFSNRRLKDEHEFHLLSFTLQQKCLEFLEMGSPAYLRSNVFTVVLAYSIKHFNNAVFVAIFRTD